MTETYGSPIAGDSRVFQLQWLSEGNWFTDEEFSSGSEKENYMAALNRLNDEVGQYPHDSFRVVSVYRYVMVEIKGV